MRITERLSGEHKTFLVRLDALETLAVAAGVDVIVDAAAALAAPLLAHARDEEELLFPALADALGGDGGPLDELGREHRAVRDLLDAIARRPNRRKLEADVDALVRLIRDHTAKEEGALFPLAARLLGDERLASLESRRVEIALNGGL